MVKPELPFDIFYIIVNRVGELPHPYSYIIDKATLHTLCLVSRDFNILATPILYSSIALSDQYGVSRLLATAESNPKLIQWCRSIDWPGAEPLGRRRLPFAETEMLSLMSSLHRFATLQTSWRPLKSLPDVNMTELALLGITFSELCSHYRYGFTNLERLVVRSIYSESGVVGESDSTIKNLLKMPRLTHLVITSIDLLYLDEAMTGTVEGLAAIIEHTPRSCRVIFGLSPYRMTVRDFDHGGLRKAVFERSEGRDIQVIGLTSYGTSGWLRDRIVNGTFWEMDLEKYRHPEHQIDEVHYYGEPQISFITLQ
jgi:hypothetical protein